jgi:hypothetical protein
MEDIIKHFTGREFIHQYFTAREDITIPVFHG